MTNKTEIPNIKDILQAIENTARRRLAMEYPKEGYLNTIIWDSNELCAVGQDESFYVEITNLSQEEFESELALIEFDRKMVSTGD